PVAACCRGVGRRWMDWTSNRAPCPAAAARRTETKMEPDYWLHRWDEGRTGFHRDDVMPLLQRHWPALELPADAAVLVPLAGKTLDMHWLAARGHPVLGAELSERAVQAFFAEAGLEPQCERDHDGLHHRSGRIDLVL